ncbi:hypothetical protein TNCV_141091 [Trichonephila clavipes]|nr:hypothetical protein TNCV_141091 [Trichonephila clavipes]
MYRLGSPRLRVRSLLETTDFLEVKIVGTVRNPLDGMEDITVLGNGTNFEVSCDNGNDESFLKHDTDG